MSVVRAKAENTGSQRVFRLLTQTGHPADLATLPDQLYGRAITSGQRVIPLAIQGNAECIT
jgi:hypothetical protein